MKLPQVTYRGTESLNTRWHEKCVEAGAREVFQRQLKYYSIGRFRLVDPDGRVIEERAARPLFFSRESPA